MSDTRHDYEIITPEIAMQYLRKNIKNRRIRPRYVTELAADMANGRWLNNLEAIKFDSDGTLLDGQHRLHAIVKAEVPVPMWVGRGASPDANDAPAPLSRTTSDIMAFRGSAVTHTAAVAAAANIVVRVIKSPSNPTAVRARGGGSLVNFIEAYAKDFDANARLTAKVNKGCKMKPSAILAVGFLTTNRQEFHDFALGLTTGANLAPNSPILTLRSWCLDTYRRSFDRDTQLDYAVAAVRGYAAFCDKRELTLIKRSIGKRFPDVPGMRTDIDPKLIDACFR